MNDDDAVLTDLSNLSILEKRRPPKIKIPTVSIPSSSSAPMHDVEYRRRALVDYMSHLNKRIQSLRSQLLTLRPKDTVDREFITEAVLETAERYGLGNIRVPRAKGLEEAGLCVGDRREFYQARLREHNEKIAFTRASLELQLDELQNIREQVLTEMSSYTKSR
jgi:vacuolar-type H+-ATPase subunit I/STV1